MAESKQIKKRTITRSRIVDPISKMVITYRDNVGIKVKEVDLKTLLGLINDPLIMTFSSIYWKGLEPKQPPRPPLDPPK